jgi:hypothetical protein
MDEGPHCAETRTPLQLDEASPIGVVPADVLARVPAEESSPLAYENGEATELSLAFSPATSAEFVDLEAVYPEGGETIDIAVICDDYVAIATDLAFVTADGRFDEDLSGEIQASAESLGAMWIEFALDAMNGSFDIADFTDVTDYDDARLHAAIAFHDGAPTSGEIAGDVSGEDECTGDECSAWDVGVPVGTWGATPE